MRETAEAQFDHWPLKGVAPSFAGMDVLADTDATMKKRGWQRIVGVIHDGHTVAVYAPAKGLSRSNIECAVLVLNGHDLIVAAGSGNPMPLIELAASRQNEAKNHLFRN